MKKKTGCWILAGFGLLSYFLYKQNNDIVTTNYTYVSNKVPTVFDGMKIVHLSDLHNKTFKESQRTLLSKIKRAHPDVVFITGDIVDSRRYHDKPSLILVNKLAQKWPVYYVTGNHERNSNHFHQLEPLIKKPEYMSCEIRRKSILNKRTIFIFLELMTPLSQSIFLILMMRHLQRMHCRLPRKTSMSKIVYVYFYLIVLN